MKQKIHTTLMAGLLLASLAIGSAHGATLIIGDDYNVTNNGTGFNPNSGVNSGINPPTTTTRLQGTSVSGIRYVKVEGARGGNLHYITNATPGSPPGKMYIAYGAQVTSVSFTNHNGTGLTDFGPALFSTAATPTLPSKYELRVDLANFGTNRVSFGISSVIGLPNSYDFGFQLGRLTTSENLSLYKRIDGGSRGGDDLNATIVPDIGPAGTELTFLMRITDAGAQSGSEYNSQLQLGIVQGVTTNWVYDTMLDGDLPLGWRFRQENRYIFWHADSACGPMTADNLSLTWIDGPTRTPIVQTWTGGGTDDNWSTAANWNGVPLASGDALIFGAAVRQNNNNDLASLSVPSLTFTTGGFQLGGNGLRIFEALTNTGNNTIAQPLTWTTSGPKTWDLTAGNELTLAGAVAVDVAGDHTVRGGGNLKLGSTFQIGQASSASPVILLADGRVLLDGANSQFTSSAGFRIGASGATAPSTAELMLSNGASFHQTEIGASCRVGSIANGITNRLIMNNSTFTQSGGEIGIPWATGATGEVIQVGGLVSDSYLTFNHDGAGSGTYSVQNGTIEARAIKKNFVGGFTAISFDSAVLRTGYAAENAFMAALDDAEIRSGGLTLDVTALDVVLSSPFSGAGALTKTGNYTATLTGPNGYAGNTVIQAGKLVLPTTQTNSAAIQVADGAQFGALLTAQESSLRAGSLSIAGASSTLSFDLGTFSNPTTPVAQVGTLLAGGQVTVNVTNGSLAMTTGTITLLKWTTLSGTPTFVLGSLPSHINANLVVDSDSVDLVVTGVQGYRWTGATSGDWDAFTQNWIYLLDSSVSAYVDGFTTEFRDGAATGIVNLGGTVWPGVIVISNSSLAYSFSGGVINTPLLKKSGSGSVTRTDGVSDQIGELQVNEGSFVTEATYDSAFGQTLTDTSSGLGSFVKQGGAVLTVLSTNSTFDGTVVVRQGTLKLGTNSVALGSTNGSTIIENGASLDVANVQAPHEPVFVSGEGVGGQGAIVNNTAGGGVQNNLTDVTMTGDTTFGCIAGSRWDIRARPATGPGSGLHGNGCSLTKVGGGALSISSQRSLGTNTPYWNMNLGNVVVKEGSIAFEEATDLGNSSKTITMFPGTTMNFFDLGVTNPILRTIIGTNCNLTCGGKAADTNILNGPIQLEGATTIRVNGAKYIINGPISGNASLEIGLITSSSTPGYVILNAINTFTGTTMVTNSTLAGNGSIAGDLVMAGGSLAPGDSVGTFTVGGNATLSGTTTMELAPGQSPNSDKLSVNGTITGGGNLIVVLAPGASAPQAGDVFQLFNKGVTGFAPITNLPGLAAGLAWDTTLLATAGSIKVVSTVPPSIGNVTITGGVFRFSGTGGTEGATYSIVTSTDVEAPMASWVPVQSSTFGPGGTFTFSTNITGGAPKAFYRLQTP